MAREMARVEVEYLRTGVTVGQFLAYVRAQLRKRGLDDFAGSLDYENFASDNGIDWKIDHRAQNDTAYTQLGIEYEEVRDLPYEKKSYQRKANGRASNEIIEFIFDSENTGRGYYYLVDDGAEDEIEPVESITEAETEADTVESVEPVESVDNTENDGCALEHAATNELNGNADNPTTAREGDIMRKTMKFANRNEFEKWVDEQHRHCEHTDEIVCVVDDGRKLAAELTTMCDEPVTAVYRLFEELDEPELEGCQDIMVEAVSNGTYSGSTDSGDGGWECVPVDGEYYHGYYVSATVYRSQVNEEEVKNIALAAIAREFAGQQKYYDEMWSYNHPDTNDCLVQYWYTWEDEAGVRYKDCVEIFLSDACRMAGVDFDVVDDGEIEGRMLEEMQERGYEVDDDNEIVIDDGADEYAICEEMDEVRSELWEEVRAHAAEARDELCDHEDLAEPWFRALCEEMLAKVNATLAE